ncbi:MAG: hypothetical protein LBQ54_03085 [Planctomycetaceae bacterium]|jgi:cobalamin biosynthesis Co2+ chelatase CbiK|nr:hypothetical protein [Planctomycetaceae bacterium]
MKRTNFTLFTAVFMTVISVSTIANGLADQPNEVSAEESRSSAGKPGLLILAHGAGSSWNNPVHQLAEKVTALNETKKTFHAVTAALLEFAQPDAVAGIETLEKAGCDRIIVVPIFICPTSHTFVDVPAALGLYSSPQTRRAMKRENGRPAAPHVPVTITPTIGEGDLLDKYVRDEIAALSVNPKEEAVVLISHGDEGHAGLINRIMERLLKTACESKGITVGEYVYCGVGATYARDVVPAIEDLAKEKKRVLVVGFYLVSSAKSISQMGSRMSSRSRQGRSSEGAETAPESRTPLEGIDVRFSEKGVIEHPEMPNWVLRSASEVLLP